MTGLFTDKKWIGEFFVPDQYGTLQHDKRFTGEIEYSPENGIILTYSITGHDVPAESDVVYGIINSGNSSKKCTLIGKFIPQQHSGLSIQDGLLTRPGKVGFSWLLVGDFVAHDEIFSKIDFSLTCMQEFFFPKEFKDRVKHSNQPLLSIKTSYGEVECGTVATLGHLGDITSQIHSNNDDALKELKKAFEDIKERYKDAWFERKNDIAYRMSMNINSGETILDAYRYIYDVASLFAILIYSPVYPEYIYVRKSGENQSSLEVFPSMVLDRRTIELCTMERSYFHIPIKKDNIDLNSILSNWLNNTKTYQTIVSSIQSETGFRSVHALHGEIVLYAAQFEYISHQNKEDKKYEYPLNKYGSNKIIDGMKKIFLNVGITDIGEGISDLRNDIAHIGRPKKLLQSLSLSDMADISKFLRITIIGYILENLGIQKEVINNYQDTFSPNV